ncbi:MAG TPA: phenylalanine--tRNA ligase subunit beta, partial [Rhizobiaceae bacterium]|nr:phenylalanine--tRNA ligase subunit beta [Rhizobiaceae bacterium]
ADMSDMRPSLLPSLVAAAQRNADRGTGDVALFEVSHVYHGDKPEDQKRVAAGIRRATAKSNGSGRHWSGSAGAVNVFDAKADALAALVAIGVDVSKVQVTNAGPDWYHPGRRGQIQLGPKLVLASFGELHPLTLEALDAGSPMTGFEVWLDEAPEPKKRATRTKPKLELSGLQAVKRDFAFVLDKDKDAASLIRAAAGADKKLISNVLVFDVFEGAAIGEGRKSLAIEVTLQPSDKTLTDEEIDAVSKRIVEAVAKATGGVLRG